MNDKGLSIAFTVDEDPDQVFAAINDVRSWWSGDIDGITDEIGSQFTYSYEDMHQSTQQITDLVPGELVIWRVVEGRIRFVKDETEWTNTVIRFDITRGVPRRSCASPTSGSCLTPNASTVAQLPGTTTWAPVCATE